MNEIVLENPSVRLVIDAAKGGSVKSFRYKNELGTHDVFRDASESDNVNDSACFPLAPFASRVQFCQFQWNNEAVRLTPNFLPQPHALHGHAWQSAWRIKSKSLDVVTLIFDYKNGDWPWDYSLELIYQIVGNALKISLTLQNNATTEMPSGLGLHPFFDIDDKTMIEVDASTMWQVDNTLLPTSIEDSPLGVNAIGGIMASKLLIDNVLINDTTNRVVTWPNRGFKARIGSTGCPFTVMYRPEGADFLCVEPISHCTNALNLTRNAAIEAGVTPLASGELHQITMTIELEAL